MLLLATASGRKCMMFRHCAPEEPTQRLAVLISRQLIVTGFRQYFRYERICMLRTQIILLFFQRVYHIIMIEEVCQPAVTFVTGNGIQIIERFVDAAKLIAYHPPTCFFVQRLQFVVCPVAHSRHNRQGLRIIRIQILVYQTGKQLVQRVPRSPNGLSLDITVYQFFGKRT